MVAVLLLKRLNSWSMLTKEASLCPITYMILHLLSFEVKCFILLCVPIKSYLSCYYIYIMVEEKF